MKEKSIKKTLFILLLGIVVFFMNGKVVNASEVVCKYDGEWGSVEIVKDWVYTDPYCVTDCDKSDVYSWNLVEPSNNCINGTSCVGKVKFDRDPVIKNGNCPQMYYSLDKTKTEARLNDQTGEFYNYDVKTITFSDYNIANEGGGTVASSIGNTQQTTPSTQNSCQDIMNDINSLANRLKTNVLPIINSASNLVTKTGASNSEYTGMLQRLNDAANELNGTTSAANKIDISSCKQSVGDAYNRLQNTLKSYNQLITTYINKITELLNDDKVTEMYEQTLADLENYYRMASNLGTGFGREDCDGILGTHVKEDIKEILTYVRIAVPIIIIVLGVVDFSKVVLAGDDKAMSKAISNLVKRAIAAVAIFFAPIIIMYLINLVDSLAGGCDIRGL